MPMVNAIEKPRKAAPPNTSINTTIASVEPWVRWWLIVAVIALSMTSGTACPRIDRLRKFSRYGRRRRRIRSQNSPIRQGYPPRLVSENSIEEAKAAENNHDQRRMTGDSGRYGKTPFKTHRQVNNDADNDKTQSHQSITYQFLTDLRADKFDLAQGNVRTVFFSKSITWLDNCKEVTPSLFAGGSWCVWSYPMPEPVHHLLPYRGVRAAYWHPHPADIDLHYRTAVNSTEKFRPQVTKKNMARKTQPTK